MSLRLAQAQTDLREGEVRYRAIVEAQDDAVCRWTPDTRLTFTNARYRELFGLTEEGARGRCWLDFVPEDERAGLAAYIEQLGRDPKRVAYEHTATAADGRLLWISWVDVPLFDADGTLVEFQSVGRDITERKAADDGLRRAHRALAALNEVNQALLRLTDEATLLRDICRIAIERGGYRMAWIGLNRDDAAQTVEPVAAAGDAHGYLRSISVSWGDSENGSGPTGVAVRTRRPAIARDIDSDPHFGPWREAARTNGFGSSIALPLLDGGGHCFGAFNLYAASRDAFDAEQVEFLTQLTSELSQGMRARRDRAALGAAEQRLRLALEAAQQGIFDLDVQGGMAEVSAEYATMLGFDPATFAETHAAWIERLHPDDRAPVTAIYRDYIAGRRPDYRVEFRQRTAQGGWKWILSIGRIVERDAQGVPRRMLGTHTDITERRQAEEALRELAQTLERRVAERTDELRQSVERAERASRAKSEFLSRMSHELRTPLNAIIGFAQVSEFSKPTEQQRGWVREIRRAGDHLLYLIDELLDLARIEVGNLTLSVEALPVVSIVHEAVAFVQPALDAREVTLQTIEPCSELTLVLTDRVRLRQIVVNLLSNAIKYNRPGGLITVGCQPRADDRLRLTVADTGIGIAADKLAALFRPFERLGAESSEVEGTGIGLALSQQLAHLMDAEIGVESTPGVGTVFWVDLPLAGHAPTPPALPPAEPGAPAFTAAGTVLYIEDNEPNLMLVQALLAAYPQMPLLTALDGRRGLELARAQRPDVILLDIHMPGLDGFEVLRALRADPSTREIPVIALSADAMPEDIARAKAAGFMRYLTKPLVLTALLQALSEALGGKP
ncbi:MAG: PAS domain S-box protein [Burkholderiaceae bacterium]|nr:PAS domain S-box protein [Burkholderiaceae bacterium]